MLNRSGITRKIINLFDVIKYKIWCTKNVCSAVSCGLTTIEYLLLGSLIAVVCAVTIGSIGANANETFGTINNAIGSKTNPDPPIPPEPDPSVPAYAMLYDDGSLVFQRGNTTEPGKTLVNSYTDFENKKIFFMTDVPWSSERLNVTTVTFKNEISPISTYAWFYEMRNCTTINLEKLNTTNVTNMGDMFERCDSLVSLDVSNFNTTNVTNMNWMFNGCSSLVSLDVTNFDTTNVTNMNWMFNGCSSLTSLDVTKFNTSKVTDMNSMFSECSSLTSLDVTKFNTSNVTDMSEMFSECRSLVSLDVTNFNTLKVTDMSYMFKDCRSLVSLNVSNFNTTNVTTMGSMFASCSKLASLDVSSFDTTKVTDMRDMFASCSSLVSVGLPVNIASSPAVMTGANEESYGISKMFSGDQKLKDAGQIPVWYVGTYATV